MRRCLAGVAVALGFLIVSAPAQAGHGLKAWLESWYLDHPAPSFAPSAPPSPAFQSGGQGAKWELIGSIPTGNPHTDIDFFTQGNEMFASVGTLATGPNGGGQTIVKLVNDSGEVDPEFVKGHPSATCPSNPAAVLGLQHDVEATPKGNALLNERNEHAVRQDAQLLVDATDSRGRCHDEQGLGAASQPRGGLELIDITPGTAGDGTDVSNPKEIGLTSHTGEAHTVNVDPKRPHIAYAVTSDDVAVTNGVRQNEVPGSDYRYDLDGFEVVDMSSCMNFPAGTTLLQKRTACRPQVFRYRYPTTEMALGHSQQNTVYGCHELEVYEDDRLACGSGAAAILFDMSGAFDNNGTPNDFTDDKPRGTPLPCTVRAAQTTDPITTGAMVTDCVDGTGPATDDLNIPNWLASGAPSLAGVRHLGTVHHMGRGGPFPSTVDNDFNHEAELTESDAFMLTTDERGGGVTPPGASCSSAADNTSGNGGIHAYRVDRMNTDGPGTPQHEWLDYARTSDGRKAIYRAPVRTGVQATVCTAHVFQQIPGQSRIFMGWYSQGTQVVDYTEHPDGSIDFRETAFFIPANANEWVSHVFKVESNDDGSFTYYGATGDFNLGERGRNTIDVWKVTLPPPPNVAAERARRAGGGAASAAPPVGGSGKCMGRRARFTRTRLGRFSLRARRSVIVRRAGTPGESRRRGRVYRYCVTRDARGAVTVAFDRRNRVRLVGSTARLHRRGRIRRGMRVATLARSSRSTRLRRGLWASPERRFVYGVRRGRVSFVAVADRSVARRPRLLVRYIRMAGLR